MAVRLASETYGCGWLLLRPGSLSRIWNAVTCILPFSPRQLLEVGGAERDPAHTPSAPSRGSGSPALAFLAGLLEMLLLKIIFWVTSLRFLSTKLILVRYSKQVRMAEAEELGFRA